MSRDWNIGIKFAVDKSEGYEDCKNYRENCSANNTELEEKRRGNTI